MFNGHAGALTGDGALAANTGERVRLYAGNAGLLSRPARGIQTTLVPAGGTTVVDRPDIYDPPATTPSTA